MSQPSQWSLSFWLYHQYLIYIPLPPFVLHTLPIDIHQRRYKVVLHGKDWQLFSSMVLSFLVTV
jgi:hypothetical protein